MYMLTHSSVAGHTPVVEHGQLQYADRGALPCVWVQEGAEGGCPLCVASPHPTWIAMTLPSGFLDLPLPMAYEPTADVHVRLFNHSSLHPLFCNRYKRYKACKGYKVYLP